MYEEGEIHIKPCEALRAQDIKRWHMVELSRQQSLAEHTYNVMIIAMAIAEAKNFGHKMGEIARVALMHDMAEVFIGDLPTPAKKVYSIWGMSAFERSCTYMGATPTSETKMVNEIVKQADIIEACLYLRKYAKCNYSFNAYTKLEKELYDSEDEVAIEIYESCYNLTPRSLYDFYNVADAKAD